MSRDSKFKVLIQGFPSPINMNFQKKDQRKIKRNYVIMKITETAEYELSNCLGTVYRHCLLEQGYIIIKFQHIRNEENILNILVIKIKSPIQILHIQNDTGLLNSNTGSQKLMEQCMSNASRILMKKKIFKELDFKLVHQMSQ